MFTIVEMVFVIVICVWMHDNFFNGKQKDKRNFVQHETG